MNKGGHYISVQEKLLTFLLHMKKLIKQIDYNNLVATGPLVTKRSINKSSKQYIFKRNIPYCMSSGSISMSIVGKKT